MKPVDLKILEEHRQIWTEKKVLRLIYTEWYAMIVRDLSTQPGQTVEIGGGSGNFKEYYPTAISADIDPNPWLDLVFDAHHMPFANNTVANLVLVDTLHHLANPMQFFAEANRVLVPGGRIIMLEPFPSPFSLLMYRLFHPEPFIMKADYFSSKEIKDKHPWESNQAIPYLLFYKHHQKFWEIMDGYFSEMKREKMTYLLYPLSGGFEHNSFIPLALYPAVHYLEKLLTPLRSLLAFRCYVVLEKINLHD